MNTREHHDEAVRYYLERYEEIVRLKFVTPQPTRLRDHAEDATRLCRFCGRGKPEVKFKKVAHAISEFLGNSSVHSLNECDTCNEFFADQYEDHLAKWSMYSRAVAQIEGKHGKPKFKSMNGLITVEAGNTGLQIHLKDPSLTAKQFAEPGPYSFKVPVEAVSQPYVPVRAAMALVKAACSICPPGELPQCRPAIDTLLQRNGIGFTAFSVLYAFTPGPITDEVSDIILLRRKASSSDPYLWCVLQWSNFRFQFFIPFCPANNHDMRADEPFTVTTKHYPSKFGPDWGYGKTRFGVLDWSGTEPIRSTTDVEFNVEHALRVNPPFETA